jgi:glycosyltransferase involved in cell wall biosynthesis
LRLNRTAKLRAGSNGNTAPDEPRPSVAVVVTSYDHAHFLDDALRSVFSQTRPAQEVFVVDDGSHDDPATVVRRWPEARLIRQDNAGLGAARNAGLRAATADFVLFLDADDRLAAEAIESHLRCFAENPDCGLVYGAHRRVDGALQPLEAPVYRPLLSAPYLELLKTNFIGMHAAVLYDRAKLVACGGFDPSLERCEGYDAYFRIAGKHPMASHGAVVADYRIHGDNMSADPNAMLDWALRVQERYRPSASDGEAMAAYRSGRRRWRLAFANAAWRDRSDAAARHRSAMIRRAPASSAAAAAWRRLRPLLPAWAVNAVKTAAGYGSPRIGSVDMGVLARARPVSRHFGYDRGKPIDRWYVERFLERNAQDIRGRVLEVGDASYSRRFGQGITRQDVLHLDPANPEATIAGDLSQPGVLPDGAFDCLVVTQTLQFIYDMTSAIEQLRRSLAPGGVLLLTAPGISSVDRGEWRDSWFWSLTGRSAERLFEEVFGAGTVEITTSGNVYAATCFLHGLAVEEIDQRLLEPDDPAYPLLVCVRARRND